MRSAQGLAVRATLVCALLASVGCFRPKILPGGFACGDAGGCPDNFNCNKGLCIANGSDAGVVATGGAGGKGGEGGKGGAAGMDAGVDRPCTGEVPNCQPADGGTGICDPVCNTGCGACYQKCSVDSTGALTCNELYMPNEKPVGLLSFCSATSPANPLGETDNCGPGEVCIAGSTCPDRCYQFCRTNADCQGGATCSRDGGTYSFCDVPPAACNPLPGAAGCGSSGSCYLSASGHTLCDCQFPRTGLPANTTGRPGDACNHSRDCLAGNVCLSETLMGKECYSVCLLPVDGGPADQCPGGCQPLPQADGGTAYGWCNF